MFEQGQLFETDEPKPAQSGPSTVEYVEASSILTRATGFMNSYDYTINPYSGCSFGCTYCYAAFFARSEELRDEWGRWLKIKQNAVNLLGRHRKSLTQKAIYMSSVTDPYLPLERKLRLTRAILEYLVPHQPRLVIQTRSPLVERDIDLFQRFLTVQVNMTVTTDSERVRKAFEPLCPSNDQRLNAIARVASAGVKTSITLTPLLPLENPSLFAKRLIETGVTRFVVQPFHTERGKFVRGTRDTALAIVNEMNWNDERYRSAVTLLRESLPELQEGREGFTAI